MVASGFATMARWKAEPAAAPAAAAGVFAFELVADWEMLARTWGREEKYLMGAVMSKDIQALILDLTNSSRRAKNASFSWC